MFSPCHPTYAVDVSHAASFSVSENTYCVKPNVGNGWILRTKTGLIVNIDLGIDLANNRPDNRAPESLGELREIDGLFRGTSVNVEIGS